MWYYAEHSLRRFISRVKALDSKAVNSKALDNMPKAPEMQVKHSDYVKNTTHESTRWKEWEELCSGHQAAKRVDRNNNTHCPAPPVDQVTEMSQEWKEWKDWKEENASKWQEENASESEAIVKAERDARGQDA